MKYSESKVPEILFDADAPYIYDGKGNYTFSLRSLAILFNKVADANKVENKPEIIPEPPKRTRMVDWGKAGALKKAGWNNKAIAEEIGVEEHQVDIFFKARKAHFE